MKEPTARQQEAWEMRQSGMTLDQIAAALGITRDAVVRRLNVYRHKTGTARSYGKGPAAQKAARLREMERLNVEQSARIADLVEQAERLTPIRDRLDRLEEKVDALLARPVATTIITQAVTHRRVADGGIGGKQERKLRRVA